MRPLRCLITALPVLVAALPVLVAAQLTLLDSCYWTSTVLYGDPAAWPSFSGMTMQPISRTPSQSSTLTSSSSPANEMMSSTTTSAKTSVPTDSLQPLYLTVGNPTSRLKQRAVRYVAFDGNSSYLVDIQETAAVFLITQDGFLMSGGQYVGSSGTAGTLSLQKLSYQPTDGKRWHNDGSSISLDAASFCYTTNEQFYVVYGDDPAQGCVKAVLVPEAAPKPETTTYIGWTSTISTRSTSENSKLVSSTASTQTSSITKPNSINNGPFPDTTVIFDTPRPLPSSTSLVLFLSTSDMSTLPTLPNKSSASTTEVSKSPSTSSISSSSVYIISSQPTSLSSVTVSVSSSALFASTRGQVTTSIVVPDPTITTSLIATSTATASPLPSTKVSLSTISTPTSTTTSPVTTYSSSFTRMDSTTISSLSITTTLSTTTRSPGLSMFSSNPTTKSTWLYTTSKSSSSATPTPSLHPAKRGIPYNNVNTTRYYSPPTFVSWAYNYYSLPNTTTNNGDYPYSLDYPLIYYPTLFNAQSSLTSIWAANVNYSIAHYGTDAVFSFNEPDACYKGLSSCMSVADAVTAYQAYIQPLAGKVRLIAPSVTNAGGLTWLSQFLGNATRMNLTIDAINIHWYASPYNMVYFIDYMKQAYALGEGRPLWITEYGMDKDNYAETAVQAFIKNTTVWCDQQPWIEKYAWFGNYKNKLLNADGTNLSAQGQIYSTYSGGYVYSFN